MTSTESTVQKIMAPRGVPDYIPQQSDRFLSVRSAFLDSASAAGYGYIELPIFEHTELFARGVGESSDIVNKEMYTFLDKGDRSITLRPEGTAGVMRAIIEHGLDRASLPIKLAYSGPMFRYENPQSGRYRQFQTVGIEAVGIDDPLLDVEVIAVLHNALAQLGLKDYRLEINSLGDGVTRGKYREKLIEFLHDIELDESTRKRVQLNPLRILDDKRAEIKSLLVQAPEILDFLSDQAKDHFQAVCDGLTRLGINYVVNPRLVRGLDYYHKTTFEFIHNCLGAQATVGGGGRYDGLLAQLGGLPLSGVGFGVGIERILLALDQEKIQLPVTPKVTVFGVPMGSAAKEYLMVLINALRVKGIKSDLCYGDKGLKAAMKAADRSGARYAIVVGERELADKKIVVKNLTNGQQSSHPMDLAVTDIEKLFGRRLAEDPKKS